MVLLVGVVAVLALGAAVLVPPPDGSAGPPAGDGATTPAATATVTATSTPAGEDPADSPTASPAASEGSRSRARVVSVTNATALTVEYANGSRVPVRLAGVTAPAAEGEATPVAYPGIPNGSTGRRWLRDWGETAAAFAASELSDRIVFVAGAGDGNATGARRSVYLYHDELELFNLQLLQLGYARVAGDAHPRRDAFVRTQAVARARGVGLWGFDAANATTSAE